MEVTMITKQNYIQTLILVWLLWFLGNLGANALFFIGSNFNEIYYSFGIVYYFVTVTCVGILFPLWYINKWPLESGEPMIRSVKYRILFATLYLATMIFIGFLAIEGKMTINEILSHDLQWILSPLFMLIPTMIAYGFLWYVLFFRIVKALYANKPGNVLLASVTTGFIYAIYHFASIDEIFTLPEMLEEVLITGIISIIICLFVHYSGMLWVSIVGNLILNWFVFSPVETFHTTPLTWLVNYAICILCVGIYLLLFRPASVESLRNILQKSRNG
jgi:membrane protease YdiL (CAAX protease family)